MNKLFIVCVTILVTTGCVGTGDIKSVLNSCPKEVQSVEYMSDDTTLRVKCKDLEYDVLL